MLSQFRDTSRDEPPALFWPRLLTADCIRPPGEPPSAHLTSLRVPQNAEVQPTFAQSTLRASWSCIPTFHMVFLPFLALSFLFLES